VKTRRIIVSYDHSAVRLGVDALELCSWDVGEDFPKDLVELGPIGNRLASKQNHFPSTKRKFEGRIQDQLVLLYRRSLLYGRISSFGRSRTWRCRKTNERIVVRRSRHGYFLTLSFVLRRRREGKIVVVGAYRRCTFFFLVQDR
jgi:hypothetical protein